MTLITEASVKGLFKSRGGSLTNRELVQHFSACLAGADSDAKVFLKRLVNKLCTVTRENGESCLTLRDSFKKELGLIDPDADGLSTSILKALNLVGSERQNDARGRFASSNTRSHSIDELFSIPELDVSLDVNGNDSAQLISSSSIITSVSCTTPTALADSTHAVVDEPLSCTANPPIAAAQESVMFKPPDIIVRSNSVDAGQLITTEEPSVSAVNDGNATHVESYTVMERARIYNKCNQSDCGSSSSSLAAPKKSTRSASEKTSDTTSEDSGSVHLVSLSDVEHQWLRLSANCDYQAMAKLLRTNPDLVSLRCFVSGYTALHWAAKFGHCDLIKLLAGTYAAPLNKRSHGGYTPLHLAAMHNQREAVDLLVDVYGANKDVRDYSGRLPRQYLDNAMQTQRITGRQFAELRRIDPFSARQCKTINWPKYCNIDQQDTDGGSINNGNYTVACDSSDFSTGDGLLSTWQVPTLRLSKRFATLTDRLHVGRVYGAKIPSPARPKRTVDCSPARNARVV